MASTSKRRKIVSAVVVALLSSICLLYGVTLLLYSSHIPNSIVLVFITYACISLGLLWRNLKRPNNAEKKYFYANNVLLFMVFVLASLDVGMVSGMEMVVLFVVLCAILISNYCFKRVVDVNV